MKRNVRKCIAGLRTMRTCLWVLCCITYQAGLIGQTNQLETDQGIAASIAPYDADVRQAILQVSQYPQVLTQLQQKQVETVTAFQNTIANYRQAKQAWFYTLTRYSTLIHTLATLPKKQSQDDINKLLPTQDPELQKAAWKLYRHNKKSLTQIDNMQVAAQQDFDKTLQNLDPSAIYAFKKLATLPDVLTLLTNNIDLTARLGEHYKSDPVEVNNRLAAIHDSLNVQNQYEISTFKKQMDEDPQANQELSQAAKDYASQNGYDVPTQQNYDLNSSNYYANPYSYWFGYPMWYSSPLWYPGAYGYGSGFYMGIGGFGYYGFPSYGFSNWFFKGGYYNHYPHLYHAFGTYYHRNMEEHRVMGGVNHGFMHVADNHFNPGGGTRMNQLTSPSSYHRPNAQPAQNNGNTGHINANTYHDQGWGSYGGRGNAVGSGSRGGGSFGGGSHGGGRR